MRKSIFYHVRNWKFRVSQFDPRFINFQWLRIFIDFASSPIKNLSINIDFPLHKVKITFLSLEWKNVIKFELRFNTLLKRSEVMTKEEKHKFMAY